MENIMTETVSTTTGGSAAEHVRRVREKGLSTRAIADVVGIDPKQVRRDLSQVGTVPPPEPEPEPEPCPTTSTPPEPPAVREHLRH